MNVRELINENLVCLNMEAKDKESALYRLGELISGEGKLCDEKYGRKKALEEFIKSVRKREKEFTTAVGFSFAIPHGKCKYVNQASVAYARLKNEIQWSEDEKVKHIFMIAVSDTNAENEHLEILIKLSTAILEDTFREKLEKAQTDLDVMKLMKEYSEKERKF